MDESVFGYRKVVFNAARNLDALRDFIEVLDTYLNGKVKDSIIDSAPWIGPMFLALHKAGGMPFAEKDEETTDVLDDLASRVPGVDNFEVGEPDEKGVRKVTFNAPPEQGFANAIEAISKAQGRSRMLYSSALMNLASTVELFFSRLLHGYFLMHPEAVGTKEKLFSFEDLAKYDSVREARDCYILSKIEDILRGPFDDWIKYMKSPVGLSMGYLKDEQPVLSEAFQRRNVIVHNGGVSNSIYLSKVPEKFRDVLEAGIDLTPSRSYLNDRIDRFEQVCVLIGAEMWKKTDPINEERAETMNTLAYQHLLAGRYAIVKSLSYFIVQDKLAPEIHRTIAQLNLWQSEKRLGNWALVNEDVSSADYSAKSLRFQLGRLALLADFDGFYQMLPRALQADEITLEELQSFPIMSDMRTDKRFTEYVTESPQLTPGLNAEALADAGKDQEGEGLGA